MKKLILILFSTLVFYSSYSQNEKIQSLFIYNFSKLINWPASYQDGDFIIGVLGNSPIANELEKMATTKKAGSQAIVIQKYSSVDAIKKCHILVISPAQSGKISSALIKINGNSTLIVTDTQDGIKKGASINFVIVDNKQKFELNENNISNKGLKVSAELIKLSIIK